MSDVELSTADPFIVTLVQKWMSQRDQVVTLDEKMALESFGRTKLLNSLFDSANPEMKDKKANNSVAVSVRNALSAEGISEEEFVGRYETIRRTLKEFEARLDKFVDNNITKVDESDKPKPEELEVMRKERKSLVDAMNGIRQLLEGTDANWFKAEGENLLLNAEGKADKWENLRGAVGDRGATGARLGATFQFTDFFNDTETAIPERKLGAVQVHLKKFVKNIGELWKVIEAANPNFDRKNPPDRFEFTVEGHRIVANKMTDETSEDDSSDEAASSEQNTEDINTLTLDISDDDPEDFEEDSEENNVTELFDDES